MLPRLADFFVLQPTRHAIPTPEKERREIAFAEGSFEVWTQRVGALREPDLFVLKFVGTGGRAERASEHPAEVWSELASEIWTVNPPGYGGSSGRASLQNLAAVADAAFHEIERAARGKPLLVTGNSLGTVAALYLAAQNTCHGLLLRNPVPLRQLIAERHGWWNFGMSKLLAKQVPEPLCSIQNASLTRVPTLFVTSRRDRVVPPHFQDRVIDAHRGPKRMMRLTAADHATAISDAEVPDYMTMLTWLRETAFHHHRQQAAEHKLTDETV